MKNNVKTYKPLLGAGILALGQTTTAPIYKHEYLGGNPMPNSFG